MPEITSKPVRAAAAAAKATKGAASNSDISHPPYESMITEAINEIGTSQGLTKPVLKKFMVDKYRMNEGREFDNLVDAAIKRGLEKLIFAKGATTVRYILGLQGGVDGKENIEANAAPKVVAPAKKAAVPARKAPAKVKAVTKAKPVKKITKTIAKPVVKAPPKAKEAPVLKPEVVIISRGAPRDRTIPVIPIPFPVRVPRVKKDKPVKEPKAAKVPKVAKTDEKKKTDTAKVVAEKLEKVKSPVKKAAKVVAEKPKKAAKVVVEKVKKAAKVVAEKPVPVKTKKSPPAKKPAVEKKITTAKVIAEKVAAVKKPPIKKAAAAAKKSVSKK